LDSYAEFGGLLDEEEYSMSNVPLNQRLATLCALASMVTAGSASAIPAFARKYGTSCQTCHTVYPNLTPFGEAFRRNGYRFPGVDSDYVKKETVALGQEGYKKVFPNAVWPGLLPIDAPIAVGFNGQGMLNPSKTSGGGKAANGTIFDLSSLVAEAHMWIGGSFDDSTTFWGEVTFSSDGTIDVEHAQILFNDLIGPPHLVNVIIGRGFQNISSFGPHSSYVADTFLPASPVTALYGSTSDSFNLANDYNGLELNGMYLGRIMYNVGINSGANLDIRPTENVYGHLGFKLGGMRLDGEGMSGPENAEKPWAETAATLDLFAYHSYSRFASAAGNAFEDTANVVGGDVRLQWQSLVLSGGGWYESHSHALGDNSEVLDPNGNIVSTGNGVNAVTVYGELSYVVWPWFVPAVRCQYLSLSAPSVANVSNFSLMPGIAFLIRPNIRLYLEAQFETAYGTPATLLASGQTAGGWSAASGDIATPGLLAAPNPGTRVPMEIEGISAFLQAAF
jgi:hypothetical protein